MSYTTYGLTYNLWIEENFPISFWSLVPQIKFSDEYILRQKKYRYFKIKKYIRYATRTLIFTIINDGISDILTKG
jgi:hypothetical protein